MRTVDALRIGMELGKISRTLDAWEESKHKRADNGQFTSGGGSSAPQKSETKKAEERPQGKPLSDKQKKIIEKTFKSLVFKGNGSGKEAADIRSNHLEWANISNEKMVDMMNQYDPKHKYRIEKEEKEGNFWTSGLPVYKYHLIREKK